MAWARTLATSGVRRPVWKNTVRLRSARLLARGVRPALGVSSVSSSAFVPVLKTTLVAARALDRKSMASRFVPGPILSDRGF